MLEDAAYGNQEIDHGNNHIHQITVHDHEGYVMAILKMVASSGDLEASWGALGIASEASADLPNRSEPMGFAKKSTATF